MRRVNNNETDLLTEELFGNRSDLSFLPRTMVLADGFSSKTVLWAQRKHSELLFTQNAPSLRRPTEPLASAQSVICRELPEWLLRTGMAAESMLPVSRAGLYMDFTCGSNGL